MLCEVLLSLGEGGIGDNFVAGQYATVESWTPLGSRAISEWEDGRLGGRDDRERARVARHVPRHERDQRLGVLRAKGRCQGVRAVHDHPQFVENNMLVEGNPSVVPDVYEDDEIQAEYPSELLDDMRFNLENAQGENYMAQPQVDDYLNEQITQALLGNKEPRAALEDAYANIERLYQDIGLI